MAKDKKIEKEPDPIDKIKERQDVVESASSEFLGVVLDFAGERGLSSSEAFAVLSGAIHKLAETAVQQEHEEYFGPDSGQDKE